MLYIYRNVYEMIGMHLKPNFCQKCDALFMFMEFSKNRLAVSDDPPGDTRSRTQFLDFFHELLGS